MAERFLQDVEATVPNPPMGARVTAGIRISISEEPGMRDFTFNLDSSEFIRITGYLVRKSDLAGIEEHGARHSSDYLAATAEHNHTVTTRAVKRITAAEVNPRG